MINYNKKQLAEINAIKKFFGLPSMIATLLFNREISSEKDVYSYFNKDYNLTNPFILPGMKTAIKRIKKALISDEKILIFGDYDVDGMMAASMLYLYFNRINANVEIYIPNRKSDGYGLNDNTVKKIIDEYSADLVISVDTGITAKNEVKKLKEYNIDVIITDHHDVQLEKLPSALSIINPKMLKKDINNIKSLSGGGVAFYLLRAINSTIFSKGNRQKIIDYLVLATLTTISDIMSLKGDNRVIVHTGLNYLFETNIVGLNIILDFINFYEYPSSKDVAFKLIPIINSAGRIGDPQMVVDLMTEESLVAFEKAKILLNLNSKRKNLSKEYFEAIENKVLDQKSNHYIFIEDKDYEIGMIGLLATRICYQEMKPTIIIGGVDDEGERKVSIRSLKGVELSSFIEEVKDIAQGGGHDYAVGLSLKDDNVKTLLDRFDKYTKNKNVEESLDVEYNISISDIDDDIVKLLYHMEPFGKNNKTPIIKIADINEIQDAKIIKKEHFKLKIADNIECLAFFADKSLFSKYNKIISEELKFSIIGEVNSSGSNLKILIKDIEIISD